MYSDWTDPMSPKKPFKHYIKNPLIISCFVCAAGSFGAFFRWLMNMLAFEKDAESYLMNPSAWPYILIVFSIAVAVLFSKVIGHFIKSGFVPVSDAKSAFRNRTPLLPIVAWGVGILMIVGGIVTLAEIDPTDSTTLLSCIGIFAMLSGVSFPSICTSSRRKFSPGLVCCFMYLPVIMFCLWLVYSYKTYATVPAVWVYAVEIVAICSAIFAFLSNIGYPAGKVKPKKAILLTMLASFFCFMTLSDERSTGLTILMLSSALMLLVENWLILSNMIDTKAEEEAEKARERAKSKAEQKLEQVVEEKLDEPVIEKGGEVLNEPTLDYSDSDVKEWKGSGKK